MPWIAGIILVLICLVPWGVSAETAFKRKVLVLVDSTGPRADMENLVFECVQMVLNHQGILPEYVSVRTRPLPDDRDMKAYRGIVTAFTGEGVEKPEAYLTWLIRQMKAGRKVVIFGNPGFSLDNGQPPSLMKKAGEVFRLLGLRYEGDRTRLKALLRYVKKDPGGVEFERKYPVFPEVYEKFVPVDDRLKVYLSLRRTDRSDSESAVIVTGPAGGFALSGFIYWEDQATYQKQWYLNPFRFFREALGLKGRPAPDPTTLNGCRVAFSHVDGDAFSGISRIDKKSLCAEVIRDQILKEFDFPVTVSVIVGEIAPEASGNPTLVKLARELFALPNVEPASHSYSHPYYWDPGYPDKEKYDRLYGIPIKGYTYDPVMEIDYSMTYISDHLSPPGKPCRVFLWSGNCEPTASDVARCDDMKIGNMNGGDTVFDDVNRSYTSVAPYYRKVGDRFQVYTGQANENILTNLWKGPYYGFRNIITTMERTGSPRRVAPIDIYYHFYSAEYRASLKALQDVYTWVLKQDTFKLYASDYIRMVRGYLDTEISRSGPGLYIVRNYGACLTLRFDDPDLEPVLSGCENVLGYSRQPQGLYVSLAPSADRAVLKMVSAKAGRTDPAPYLIKASGWVQTFKHGKNRLDIHYKGFGRGRIEIGGLPRKRTVRVTGSGLPDGAVRKTTDPSGVLTLTPVTSGALRFLW
jgi:hypothetical protein